MCGPACREMGMLIIWSIVFPLSFATAASNTQCGCGCCQPSYRRPSMQVNGDQIMCVRAPGSCPEQCQAGDMNAMAVATKDGVMDTSRYCLMDCLPFGEDLTSACKELSAAMVSQQAEGGTDPAEFARVEVHQLQPRLPPKVVVAEEEAAQAADQDAFQEAVVMAKVQQQSWKDKIEQRDPETGVMVARAAARRAEAAALDARASKAEVSSAAAVLRATNALRKAKADARTAVNVKRQIQESAARAADFAQIAIDFKNRAQQDLEDIKNAPVVAAQEALAAAVSTLQQRAKRWRFDAALEAQALTVPTQPTAQPSAEAYYVQMQRSMAQRLEMQTVAQNSLDQASAFEQDARRIRLQAADYARAGKAVIAQQMTQRAEGLESQAANADLAAKQTLTEVERLDANVRMAAQYGDSLLPNQQRWSTPSLRGPPSLPAAPRLAFEQPSAVASRPTSSTFPSLEIRTEGHIGR